MKTGRKPKPVQQKIAEGNPGKRKLNLGAELPAGPFQPPFPLEGAALVEWERIVAAAYWLRETDSVAIADRCLCFQRMLDAEQDIRDRGHLVRTRNGKVTNPSIRIARSYRLSIQRYDAELGLTASSRGRVEPDGVMPATQTQPQRRPIDPLEDALCGPIPN